MLDPVPIREVPYSTVSANFFLSVVCIPAVSLEIHRADDLSVAVAWAREGLLWVNWEHPSPAQGKIEPGVRTKGIHGAL